MSYSQEKLTFLVVQKVIVFYYIVKHGAECVELGNGAHQVSSVNTSQIKTGVIFFYNFN